jgi:hypothetical protein
MARAAPEERSRFAATIERRLAPGLALLRVSTTAGGGETH